MFKEEKSEIEMSKELIELNSIEIIKNMFIDYDKNFEYYGDFPTLNLERKKAIETVLNLIKKQKAEIEKKDRQLEERTNRIRNLEKECQSNFDNMMDTIQDNSEKDKIIDLMAEKLKQLREASLDDCFIPRSYRDIDDCLRTTCEECIKEYFEKKAEESK